MSLSISPYKYGCDSLKQATPAAVGNFIEIDGGSAAYDSNKYLFLITSMIFIATCTGLDVLFLVAFLATRCRNTSIYVYLHSLLSFWYSVLGLRILVHLAHSAFVPTIFAGASHHIHPVGRRWPTGFFHHKRIGTDRRICLRLCVASIST